MDESKEQSVRPTPSASTIARFFATVGRGEDATAAFLARHWFAGLVIVFSVSVLALWKVPQWQTSPALSTPTRFEAEDHARATLAQILGGFFLLTGIYFTWRNLEVAREGQITERFTRAIDQLGAVDDSGKPKLEIRLGGIYALERLARDSERDHWPIMEILTAYVREHAPLKEDAALAAERVEAVLNPKRATDIEAILTVLGRRTQTYGKGEDQGLDLTRTDLHRANLSEANLRHADLTRANLEGANLGKANLQGATLTLANLVGVNLSDANLRGAILARANLQGAILDGANLEGANLLSVQLWRAVLNGANLQNAKHLNQLQLSSTVGDKNTVLPSSIQIPESWKEPTRPRAQVELAGVLEILGDHEKAIKYYQLAATAPADDAEAEAVREARAALTRLGGSDK
jgi:hypothetical protein